MEEGRGRGGVFNIVTNGAILRKSQTTQVVCQLPMPLGRGRGGGEGGGEGGERVRAVRRTIECSLSFFLYLRFVLSVEGGVGLGRKRACCGALAHKTSKMQ